MDTADKCGTNDNEIEQADTANRSGPDDNEMEEPPQLVVEPGTLVPAASSQDIGD